jgi:hypothetical protein
MENKNIVFSDERQERPGLPHHAILVFQGFGIALLVFLIAGLWYLIGFRPAFIAILALCILGTGAWLAREAHHHVHDIKDRKHIRELSSIAIANHHSIEFNPATRQLRTISPFTIPDGPLTIKDVTIGNASQLAPVLPTAPAFRSLISHIRPGHLFLAQGQDKPIWGDITDLLSTLDVGRPGTGKSTLLRMVCGQVLLIGGKPIIMDPHGSILDDLGSEFDCAESPQDIAHYSHMLDKELTQRLANRRAGQEHFKPLLLLVDEMPIISEMSQEALSVIRRVVLEGRKVGMYALVSGQGVPSSILGGTLVRDAMSSRYVFHTTPQQARMAGIENETAKQMMAILETAGPGKAVLSTANRKPEIVAIPDTNVDDILFIVNRKQTGNKNGNSVETAPEAVADDSDDSLFPVSTASDDVSSDDGDSVGNTIRETIKRMRAKGMLHRDIAALVGLSGRKYPMYQAICKEEGIE